MKVAILVPSASLKSGGAATYNISVLQPFRNTSSSHEFIFLDSEANILDKEKLFDLQKDDNYLGSSVLAPENNKARINKSLSKRHFFFKFIASITSRLVSRFYQFVPSKSSMLREISISEKLDKLKIDIVWFLEPFSWPVTKPFMVQVFDLITLRQSYFPEVSLTGWKWEDRERYYSTILPRAAKIIVGTQTGKQEVVNYYSIPHERVMINPFPVPIQSASFNNQLPPLLTEITKTPYLFYPAQFWPHKNHFNLLQALSACTALENDCPNLVLTGSDKGNEQYIRRLVDDLNLSTKVFFLGFVRRSDIYFLLGNALALVYPTFFGPDNLPPLEAFHFGCPVLASSVPGAFDQLGDAALFFDPSKPDEIAECIIRIVREPGLRSQLAAKGKVQLKGRTPKDYHDRIIQFLNEFEPIRRTWEAIYIHT